MNDEQLLEKYGWSLDCQSPLEISHKDGSFARYLPAELLIDHLREIYEEEEKEMREKSNAISPEDVDLTNVIPKYVTDAVNKLIRKKYRGNGSFTILQKDIIAEIKKNKNVTSQHLFDNRYLDFEEVYREQGWNVSYDKPSYGDSDFDAYFKFTPKKK
jgi:hypothetical protein